MDKFPKKYLNKNVMPSPIRYDEQWANEEPYELLLDFIYYLSRTGEAFESEARVLWEQYL